MKNIECEGKSVMGEYHIRKCRNSQYSKIRHLILKEYRSYPKEEADVLVAWTGEEEEVACGALMALYTENQYRILSLFVEEEYRNHGIGRLLLKEAQAEAAARGEDRIHIIYRAGGEEAMRLHKFLFSEGFCMPRTGSRIFRITFEELKKTYLANLSKDFERFEGNITEFRELPPDVYREYYLRVGKEIPEFLTLEHAVGKVIPEFCLAYCRQRKVTAFLIMTEAEDGLYLNSAYIQKKSCAPALIHMLQYVLSKLEKNSRYSHLTINAVNVESERLIEKLFTGADYVRQTVYISQKRVSLQEDYPYPEGFGGVMARINALTDVLTGEGYKAELETVPGGMPFLRLWVPEEEKPAYLEYISLDGEAYSGFLLLLRLEKNGELSEACLEEPPGFQKELPLKFIKKFLNEMK